MLIAMFGLVVGTEGLAAASAAPGSSRAAQAKELATEACEQMVHDAVVSAVGGSPLPGPQTGVWTGKRYTCTYPLTGGQFVVRVDTFATRKRARSAYAKAVRSTRVEQKLLGLGQQAFLARDGHVTAQKDLFVLVADPSQVPRKVDKANVALAAAEAVLSCWAGTSS